MTLINQNYVRAFQILLIIAALPFVSGCGSEPAAEGAQARYTVIATTTMIDDLVRTLVGDHGEIIGLMKPGQDPHVYEVLPRDAQAIAAADLIVANGLRLEATLHDVIENNASGKIVYAAEHPAIDPLGSEDYAGAPDPHCWMDPELYRHYVTTVRDALVQLDPEHADDYAQRADDYLAELDELGGWVREQFASIPEDQRVIVTSHDAFQYFGNAFGIEVHGVIGISTEQSPRPQDVVALENMVRERGVRALFIETSTAPALNDLVRKIADNTGVSVGGSLYSDSLGLPDSGADTYLGMMRHNVETVVQALQ
ncbi:MAG: metal ABC transporter substrate-binding protein [Planctomycetota bacterium]